LLSSNHTKLFPLNLGMFFESLDHFFRSARHVCKGFFLCKRVIGLEFCDGRVCLKRQYASLGHCSTPGQLYQSRCECVGTLLLIRSIFLSTRRRFIVRLAKADDRLLPFGLAWCSAWTHHIWSYVWILNVWEGLLLAGAASLSWVMLAQEVTLSNCFVFLWWQTKLVLFGTNKFVKMSFRFCTMFRDHSLSYCKNF